MATKLDYTRWNHIKEKLYGIIINNDIQNSVKISDIMAVLEEEKIIRLRDETDTERERRTGKKPKPQNLDRGKYHVEKPKAKLSCGCVFDYSEAEDYEYCDYHSRELGAAATAILSMTEETEQA